MDVKKINQEDYAIIDEMLDQALDSGFEVETIYWALMVMKKDPSLSPGQAMALGITEWIKP